MNSRKKLQFAPVLTEPSENTFQNILNLSHLIFEKRKGILSCFQGQNNVIRRQGNLSKLQKERKSKQKYIQAVGRSQDIIGQLMKPTKFQSKILLKSHYSKRQYKQSQSHVHKAIKSTVQKKKYARSIDQLKNKKFGIDDDVPDFLKDMDKQRLRAKAKKTKKLNINRLSSISSNTRPKSPQKKPYNLKLKEVLEKKKLRQAQLFNDTLKKLKQNSVEFRMKRHLQITMQKQRQKHKEVLQQSLVKFLIKSYMIKTLSTPLALARQIKIQNFAKKLKTERLEKNIRKVFVKAKVRFGLKKLRSLNISRFTILLVQWRKYVIRFRARKYEQKRKSCIQQMLKTVLKDKIKLGLSTTNLNIRKLQRLRDWVALVRNERMKCLKYIWRVQLFSVLKLSLQNQSTLVCHLPKNSDQITFQSLYTQKVQQNPNLSLQNFLNKCPIFKIKVEYFKNFANLFKQQQKPIYKSQKIINYLTKSRKPKIQFIDVQQDENLKNQKSKQFRINILNSEIFPYSLHYNAFTRPKNYDIAIPQIMKKNDKWIRQQKQILQKCLLHVIRNHQKAFVKKHREYDRQLALFIKSKYEFLCEKRWKYIIEYNKIEKTISKKKKQKQLNRIMDLIGMRKIIEEDCIPEKHAILNEALKRKECPKPPNPYIQFGNKQFKEIFKVYYDNINAKIKVVRKHQV